MTKAKGKSDNNNNISDNDAANGKNSHGSRFVNYRFICCRNNFIVYNLRPKEFRRLNFKRGRRLPSIPFDLNSKDCALSVCQGKWIDSSLGRMRANGATIAEREKSEFLTHFIGWAGPDKCCRNDSLDEFPSLSLSVAFWKIVFVFSYICFYHHCRTHIACMCYVRLIGGNYGKSKPANHHHHLVCIPFYASHMSLSRSFPFQFSGALCAESLE